MGDLVRRILKPDLNIPLYAWVARDQRGALVAEVEIYKEGDREYTARYGSWSGDEMVIQQRAFKLPEGTSENVIFLMMAALANNIAYPFKGERS
jgi:hypothetical protein